MPSPAAADVERFEFDIPIGPFFIACLDEEVVGVWQIRQLLNVRGSANGGLHVTDSWRITGLIVGLTSGTEWATRGTSNWRVNAQGEQVTLRRRDAIVGIAPGEGQTLIGNLHETLVINANGVVTRDFFIDTIECRGPQ